MNIWIYESTLFSLYTPLKYGRGFHGNLQNKRSEWKSVPVSGTIAFLWFVCVCVCDEQSERRPDTWIPSKSLRGWKKQREKSRRDGGETEERKRRRKRNNSIFKTYNHFQTWKTESLSHFPQLFQEFSWPLSYGSKNSVSMFLRGSSFRPNGPGCVGAWRAASCSSGRRVSRFHLIETTPVHSWTWTWSTWSSSVSQREMKRTSIALVNRYMFNRYRDLDQVCAINSLRCDSSYRKKRTP